MQTSPERAHQGSQGSQPSAAEVPLEIRDRDQVADQPLRAWVRERVGRQLGKFASQIERVDVRFGDDNGPRGGIDHNCLVHVVLRALPPIGVEVLASTSREAFDLAAGRAERALKHSIQKRGFSTKHKRRQRSEGVEALGAAADGGDAAQDGASLYGRH